MIVAYIESKGINLKSFEVEDTGERRAFSNYPDQRRPIAPQEVRNAESKKMILVEFALQWADKWEEKGDADKVEIFTKAAKYMAAITDPRWFLDIPREESAKDTLRRALKEAGGK